MQDFLKIKYVLVMMAFIYMHLLMVKKKTNTNKTNACFLKHIQEGSHLIHDKERGHYELVEQLKPTSENYDANQVRNEEDINNPLDPINHQIDFYKSF